MLQAFLFQGHVMAGARLAVRNSYGAMKGLNLLDSLALLDEWSVVVQSIIATNQVLMVSDAC